MITDIPSANDFQHAGLDFINLGMDHVFTLYDEFEISDLQELGDQDEIALYWSSAQRPLSNALTLVQQGIEFLLKGRIVNVSPYLLISRELKEWPKKCEVRDVPYSEFRMVDAQDLVRLHDTINQIKLSQTFRSNYEELRRRRNKIMHTIDHSLEIDARAIILYSLDVIHELIGPLHWIPSRRNYLESSPKSAAFSPDYIECEIIIESLRMIRLLTTGQLIKYFGFNKRQRRYICPTCIEADEVGYLRPNTALLNPNTPSSTSIDCFVCGHKNEVIRERCSNQNCCGNVLEVEDGRCLTCYSMRTQADSV